LCGVRGVHARGCDALDFCDVLQHFFNFFRTSSSISFIQNVEAYDVTIARASPFAEFYFANT
jgi:hypothetical protein